MNRFFSAAAAAALSFSLSFSAYAQEPITKAQPALPTAPLVITTHDGKAHPFTVELARTEREQEIGEMFRTELKPDRGMLFLWATPRNADMWMRNTLVPLDIVFIDSTHHIHAIAENTVPRSEAILRSHGVVASTLELAGGVTEALGIEVGDAVSSPAFTHERDR